MSTKIVLPQNNGRLDKSEIENPQAPNLWVGDSHHYHILSSQGTSFIKCAHYAEILEHDQTLQIVPVVTLSIKWDAISELCADSPTLV
jgi:hypothetical protein